MGLHGRFKAGLTANEIKVLRSTDQNEEQYGTAERVKELVDRLLSTEDGQNLASLIKIADAGNKFTATTLEGVLAELAAGTAILDSGIPYTRADGSKKNIGAGDDTVRAALDKLDDTIAALSGLATSAKTSVVASINELVTLLSGLRWKPSAAVKGLLGRKTIADIDALAGGATRGDSYIAEDAGTPAQGASDALVAGDIAEWDGTQWKKIVSAAGGFVPAGTLAILGSGTLVGTGFTDVTDRNKVATFDGTTNAPTLAVPADADARLVTGSGSVNENRGFVYDSDPAGWNDVLGPTLYATATPAAVGTAAVGTSARLAREDHVHAHGDQGAVVGSLHDADQIDYELADNEKNKIQNASDTVAAALADLDDAMPRDDNPTNLAAAADRVTNTAVETEFATKRTFAGGFIEPGDAIDFVAFFTVAGANTNHTLMLMGKLGNNPFIGIAAWDPTDAPAGGQEDVACIRGTIYCRTAAKYDVIARGVRSTYDGQTQSGSDGVVVDSSVDWNNPVDLEFAALWSSAHADNKVDLRKLVVSVRKIGAVV